MQTSSSKTSPGLSRETILDGLDRLIGLVEKLPAPLKDPLLKEVGPIREGFIRTRPARLAITGSPAVSSEKLVTLLAGGPVSPGEISETGWVTWTTDAGAQVRTLDLREVRGSSRTFLGDSAPDAVVALQSSAIEADVLAVEFGAANELVAQMVGAQLPRPGLLGLTFEEPAEVGIARLRPMLTSQVELITDAWRVMSVEDREEVTERLCGLVPIESRLELGRFCMSQPTQAAIAKTLLASFAGVCGIIGLQPIPLADLPILTSLQTLMVGLVIYASGRKLDKRLVQEFLAAVGVNVGVGFLFREGARQLVKVLPVAGNAVSGMVAAAGTYAIGRAAIAYFIEGRPIEETRKLAKTLSLPWGRKDRE